MRRRNDQLRTGDLLSPAAPATGSSRGILFMVEGAASVEPLGDVHRACTRWEALHSRPLEWRVVEGASSTKDLSRVVRLEAAELADLSGGQLDAILGPALTRLVEGHAELFPRAGGAVGTIATGLQFLDRQVDVEGVLAAVRAGRHVLVLAPRRTGKSSLLTRVLDVLPPSHRGVLLNAEADNSLESLAARLWSLVSGELYRPSRELARKGWEALFARACTRLAEGGARAVVVLDELVSLLENLVHHRDPDERRASCRTLLEDLARIASDTSTILVIAGSIGLEDFLSSQGLETSEVPGLFASLERYALTPLSEASLEVQMRRVLLGTGLVPSREDLAWLRAHVDLALPYPALLFLDHLDHEVRARGEIDTRSLDDQLTRFLDHTNALSDFELQLERKGERDPEIRSAAELVIDRLARSPAQTWVEESDLRSVAQDGAVLEWVQETFPVRREAGRMMIASTLFWRWWRRQQGVER